MEKIAIKTQGRDTSYYIYIENNLLSRIGCILKEKLPAAKKAFLISDENVFPIYGSKVLKSLEEENIKTDYHIVKASEESKSLAVAEEIYNRLYEFNLERTEPLLALGGGVVGDLTGFVAGSWLRGVPFLQLPTTLEASIDASIGGKTAVNHPKGKNLIGLFYQPIAVIIDPSTLKTLSRRDIIAGLAESIKHAAIKDRDLFDFHKEYTQEILSLNSDILEKLIAWNCRIKAEVVSEDEREQGQRAILNFGHTFGHVIELLEGFSYRHGESVAIGMLAAGLISNRLGYLKEAEFHELEELIKGFGLPTRWERAPSFEEVLDIMKRDKKVKEGKLRFVLLEKIGKARITEIENLDLIREALNYIKKAA